jgi:hypothetical protein
MTTPNNPLTAEEVAAIQARVDAATGTVWEATQYPVEVDITGKEEIINNVVFTRNSDGSCFQDIWGLSEADAKFIAHSRTDIPRLCASHTALLAENARLRRALEPFDISGEGDEDFPDSTPCTVTFGRTTHYALTLGDLRRLRDALAASGRVEEGA